MNNFEKIPVQENQQEQGEKYNKILEIVENLNSVAEEGLEKAKQFFAGEKFKKLVLAGGKACAILLGVTLSQYGIIGALAAEAIKSIKFNSNNEELLEA